MLGSDYKELLEDGKLLLYVRNAVFYARVYVGDRKYIHKSLKTSKLTTARKLAQKLFYEIEFRQAEKLPLQSKSFSDVLTEYIKLRQADYERGQQQATTAAAKQHTSIYMLRQIKRVANFWHEYCGKMAVVKIDNAVLADYVGWRKEYYSKKDPALIPKNAKLHPKAKTLEWETTFAKTVIKYAHERGYRGKAQLPTWRYKAKEKIVRPTFTVPEYIRIYERMRKWIRETDNVEWRYTRELLRDYVLILANSGMRVGEANNLKESDIVAFTDEKGRKNYMFNVRGKTGKRTVIARTNVVRYVDRVLKRNAEWKERWASKVEPNPSRSNRRKDGSLRTAGIATSDGGGDWFFRMTDGNAVITLIDQFKAVLSSINLTHNREGQPYTLYSLRHFYAVQMLSRAKIGVFDVARNMGTSVQIIEQYYGKAATPIVLATQLGG